MDKLSRLLGAFPSRWQLVPLSSVAYFQEGPGITNDKFRDRGVPFLNIRCFENGEIIRDRCQFVDEKLAFGAYKHFLLNAGDLVFSSSGTIGKIAVIKEADLPLMLNTSTIRFRAIDESRVTTQYIKIFLQSHFFDNQFTYHAQGSAQANVGPTHLALMQIPLPPPEEQLSVCSNQVAVGELIRSTESLISKYQSIKQGLMHDLFTRGIDENGKLRPRYEDAPQLYKKTELGWVPKEWKICPLGAVATLQRGFDITEADLVPGKYPVISSSGIVGFHNRATTRGPNVLVGRKGTIGKVHYVENDFWAHDTSLFVTDFHGNNERFVYYLFVFKELERYGTKSGSPSLNRNDIHPRLTGNPQVPEQHRICRALDTLLGRIDLLVSEEAKLRALKQGLMHDLLTGKVPVKLKANQQKAA